jgi:hypothetical protein
LKSLASFDWNSTSSSTVLFTMKCAVGSIVDVELAGYMSSAIAAGAWSPATAVVGSIYYSPLDGATNSYAAVGLPTTH